MKENRKESFLVRAGRKIPALKDAVKAAEKKKRRSESSPRNGARGGREPYHPEVYAEEYLTLSHEKERMYTLRFFNDRWYTYRNGVWRVWQENDVKGDVTKFLQQRSGIARVSSSLINDVFVNLKSHRLSGMDSLQYRIPCILPDGESAAEWMPMRNQAINIRAIAESIRKGGNPPPSAFRAHSPSLFITYGLGYDYDPAAICPKWKTFLSEVQPDAWHRRLLQMLAGLLLTPDTSRQVAFFLEGDGGTGKSVFLNVLQAMLGEENCSCVPPSSFGKRFALAALTEKLANIVGELPVEEGFTKIADIETTFKMIATGDRIRTERKYKNDDGTGLPAIARLVIATNKVPQFTDRSDGVWDRIRIIPFNQRFRNTPRQNPHLAEELISSELPGVLNWAIHGLAELQKIPAGFPESPEGEARKNELREGSDHEKAFLLENVEMSPPGSSDNWISSDWLYRKFSDWMESQGYRALGAANFSAAVKRIFPKAIQDRKNAETGKIRIWRNIKEKREL